MEEKKHISTELKWDVVNNGNNVDFKKKYQRVEGWWGWNICVGDRIISNKDYDEYEWEIKCNNIGGGEYCMGLLMHQWMINRKISLIEIKNAI